MKSVLSFFMILLLSIPALGYNNRVFCRVKSETPHNIHFALGTSLFIAKTMPVSMALNYSVDVNLWKVCSINYFQTFLPYAAEEYTGFYQLGRDKSDYEYGELRVGVSIHILDWVFKKKTKIPLKMMGGLSVTSKLLARDIIALRGGYDRLKGRAAFDDTHEYPFVVDSFYAGFSWTRVQSYETWALQYGTPGAYRRFQLFLDLLYMPDDSAITAYGGDANQLGFRIAFQARSTIFSFMIEGGIRPGLKGNPYFAVGVGSRFSLLVKPLSSY